MDNANNENKAPTVLTALTDLLDECLKAGHGTDKDYQWPSRIAAAQAAIAAASEGPIPASVSDEELRKDARQAHEMLSELCYNHDDKETLTDLVRRVTNILESSTAAHQELRKDARQAHDLLSEMCYNHDDKATLSDLAQRVANIVATSTGVTYLASGPLPTAPAPAPAAARG